MITEVTVGDRKVAINAYPVGGLGWSWTLLIEGQPELRNSGPLCTSEKQAVADARRSAERHLLSPPPHRSQPGA